MNYLQILWAAVFLLLPSVAMADSWGSIATISAEPTTGYICYGNSNGKDITCNSSAPYVDSATGYLGIGTSTPAYNLDTRYTVTGSTNGVLYIGNNVLATIKPASDQTTSPSGAQTHAIYAEAAVDATSTHTTNWAVGITGAASNHSTAAVSELLSFNGWTENYAAAAISDLWGGYFGAENDAGTVTNLYGTENETYITGGTVTNHYGLYTYNEISGGAVTNQYGVYIDQRLATGTLANRYGLYIAAPTGTPGTSDYAIYSAATKNSYLAGNLRLAASKYLNFGATAGTSGYGIFDNAGTLQYKNSGGAWTNFGSASSLALSAITAATATNTLDNTNYAQTWNWDSLASGNALSLASTSTAGTASSTSTLLNVSRSGTNANTAHTAYGVYSTVTNTNATSGTNVAGYFSASGATTANYGLIVANGNVGIGTTVTNSTLSVNGTARFFTASQGDLNITHSGLITSIKGASTVPLAIGANGSEAMRINTSNNVGIGSTAPTEKLDVSGNAKVSGTMQVTYALGEGRLALWWVGRLKL